MQYTEPSKPIYVSPQVEILKIDTDSILLLSVAYPEEKDLY